MKCGQMCVLKNMTSENAGYCLRKDTGEEKKLLNV